MPIAYAKITFIIPREFFAILLEKEWKIMRLSIETGGGASDERRKLAAERKRANAAKREYIAAVRAEADREAYIEEKKARAKARAEAEEWQKAQEQQTLKNMGHSLVFWGKVTIIATICTIAFVVVAWLLLD